MTERTAAKPTTSPSRSELHTPIVCHRPQICESVKPVPNWPSLFSTFLLVRSSRRRGCRLRRVADEWSM